jgi:hypothetical protein
MKNIFDVIFIMSAGFKRQSWVSCHAAQIFNQGLKTRKKADTMSAWRRRAQHGNRLVF